MHFVSYFLCHCDILVSEGFMVMVSPHLAHTHTHTLFSGLWVRCGSTWTFRVKAKHNVINNQIQPGFFTFSARAVELITCVIACVLTWAGLGPDLVLCSHSYKPTFLIFSICFFLSSINPVRHQCVVFMLPYVSVCECSYRHTM